jgi:Fe-Mn family superoxide dismutase
MNEIREIIDLLESKNSQTLEMVKLPGGMNSFTPVLSSALMQLHYGKLYKGYVTRYNAKEGDCTFNEAGARLHDLYFSQFKTRSASNRPTGRILDMINREYGDFVTFKKAITEECMKVQGSGWVYVNRQGKLKQIKNHRIPSDGIVIIIDMWEHAFQMDYHSDKKKYIDSLWKIMDWSVINQRT